uniref:DM13 domain-containing protein n=1 Tax=Globodera rostochiensis TaxID=31243 RepID=A0A914HJX7_GLORO
MPILGHFYVIIFAIFLLVHQCIGVPFSDPSTLASSPSNAHHVESSSSNNHHQHHHHGHNLNSINDSPNKWVPNVYTTTFGTYIGPMRAHALDTTTTAAQPPRDIGHLFAVNETVVQCVNCTFAGDVADTFFWLDHSEVPTRDGVRLPTYEFGLSPLGQIRPTKAVLLVLPDNGQRISQYRSLSLYTLNGDVSLGSVRIPENLVVPRSQLLPDELRGNRYDVQSGPIQILDTRTIKIYGFIFQGDKAPDGYFYVGRGLNVSRETGVKASIRGRDTSEMISPMNERYTGGKDIFVELPEGYDVHHIDWLSVYCVRFEVDYGHIFIRNISPMIPPYVSSPIRFDDELIAHQGDKWSMNNLLGMASQLNFTFQLGPPGGKRGYKTMLNVARPPKYVWYVNGYIAELYLKRGVTYTFIIEGGHNETVAELYNPFYLTDSFYGGYAKLSNDEKQKVRKFTQEEIGRLCRWTETKMDVHPDEFATFVDFRDTLTLECDDSEQASIITFTPDRETPDTLYFASYFNYQMGGRIHIVEEFPANLKHIIAEPYRYDARRHQESLELSRDNSAKRTLMALHFVLLATFTYIFFSAL